MSTIRLEHDQFAAAPALADVLTDRLLTVAPAAGDSGVGGDLKSTTYICSAAYEASIGGEEAAVARGRSLRAGKMMIIDENAPVFSLTEALGGKLIRLALPRELAASAAENYGLQLTATLCLTSARLPAATGPAAIAGAGAACCRRMSPCL